MKTILILGAGIGGVAALHRIKKSMRKSEPIRIILFEKENKFTFAPSLPWLMIGKRAVKDVQRNIETLADNNVQIVYGKIQSIDAENISVTSGGKDYFGDFMIIAPGAETKTENYLDEYGFNFFDINGANSFHERLKNFNGGKIIILVSSLPFKCPASPYEAAFLVESYIRKKGIRDKTEISIYTPEVIPLPVAGEAVGEAVKSLLKQKHINYFTSHQIVSASEKQLTFANDKIVDFDLLAFTPKHTCPSFLSGNSLLGKSGWVEVDKHKLETKFPNVFAIGDVTSIPLEVGKPLPKAGVFAHYQAEVVAHNILENIYDGKKLKSFDGYGECFVELGDGAAGYAKGKFYASPAPQIEIKKPGYWWHLGKVWFEKYWRFKYF